MVFLAEDILFIEEVIENLYDNNLNIVKELKDFLNTKNIKIKKETEIRLAEFKEKAIEICSSDLIFKLNTENMNLFYECIVGGLLMNLVKTDSDLILKGSTSAVLWQDKYDYFSDLLGFQNLFGINILGVITKMNDKTYYQYFSYKDDKIIFNELDIEIDTEDKITAKGKILEHILKNNTTNYVEYDKDELYTILDKFVDADEYIISVLSDFIFKYTY